MRLKYTKEDEEQIIKFLRFRGEAPAASEYTYMALKDIAKHLGKSVSYVHAVCEKLKEED